MEAKGVWYKSIALYMPTDQLTYENWHNSCRTMVDVSNISSTPYARPENAPVRGKSKGNFPNGLIHLTKIDKIWQNSCNYKYPMPLKVR
jgi:hypothetical protein